MKLVGARADRGAAAGSQCVRTFFNLLFVLFQIQSRHEIRIPFFCLYPKIYNIICNMNQYWQKQSQVIGSRKWEVKVETKNNVFSIILL